MHIFNEQLCTTCMHNLAQLVEIQTVIADSDLQLGTLARRRHVQHQILANIGDVQDAGTAVTRCALDECVNGQAHLNGFSFGLKKNIINIGNVLSKLFVPKEIHSNFLANRSLACQSI